MLHLDTTHTLAGHTGAQPNAASMPSGALFPLTLTLSLWERERLSTAWEYSLNSE
jgi:hypothetical protein